METDRYVKLRQSQTLQLKANQVGIRYTEETARIHPVNIIYISTTLWKIVDLNLFYAAA